MSKLLIPVVITLFINLNPVLAKEAKPTPSSSVASVASLAICLKKTAKLALKPADRKDATKPYNKTLHLRDPLIQASLLAADCAIADRGDLKRVQMWVELSKRFFQLSEFMKGSTSELVRRRNMAIALGLLHKLQPELAEILFKLEIRLRRMPTPQ